VEQLAELQHQLKAKDVEREQFQTLKKDVSAVQ